MNVTLAQQSHVTVIKPRNGWCLIDVAEMKEYRDLFLFLVLRDIKILYAQTILGFAWAILNPLSQIFIYTMVFGRVARVSSDGVPYVVFCSVAVIPWAYMSQAMMQAGQSLVSGQEMLSKVYFPRLLFPLTPVFSKLVDFIISLAILMVVLAWHHVAPSWNLLLLPFFIVMMVCVPAAVGIWLSSLAVRFRDVKFAMTFVVSMLMFSAPIVYSASSIPSAYRAVYSLNPLVAVIEGIRASLLGTQVLWSFIWPGVLMTLVMLVASVLSFRRTERIFADVV
jgi:lipopolysaccharide transport system permease protein